MFDSPNDSSFSEDFAFTGERYEVADSGQIMSDVSGGLIEQPAPPSNMSAYDAVDARAAIAGLPNPLRLYESAIDGVQNFFGNPYVVGTLGGLQGVGGLLEMGLGASLEGAPFGQVLGSMMILHGADQVQAGFNTLINAEYADTFTKRGLMGLGVDPTHAGLADAGLSLFGTGGVGFARVSGMLDELSAVTRPVDRFLQQGFTPAQAEYLAEPYAGMGHHYLRRSSALPEWLKESPLSILRPHGISRGDFYELHYRVDPSFHGTSFPRSIGGTWRGAQLGIERYGFLGRQWYGAPAPLKITVGAAAAGAGSAGYYFMKDPLSPNGAGGN